MLSNFEERDSGDENDFKCVCPDPLDKSKTYNNCGSTLCAKIRAGLFRTGRDFVAVEAEED